MPMFHTTDKQGETNMKTIAKSIAVLGVISLAHIASAAISFPNTDGSGDISSAAAWDGTLPSATDAISISTNYYNNSPIIQYKALADASFNNMVVMTKRAMFDLTENSPKISIVGLKVYGEARNNDWKSSNASVTFKGGTWDLGGSMLMSCNTASGEDHRGNNRIVQFIDGAVVTNAGYVRVSYQEFGHTLRLSGAGTRLHATNMDGFDYNTSGKSNAFEVVQGAKASFSGFYKDTKGGSVPSSDVRVWYRTLVSGENSSLTTDGLVSIGTYYGGCTLDVVDGAVVQVKGNDGISVGNAQHSPDNTATVSNGTINAKSLKVGYLGTTGAASGNTLVIAGETPRIEVTGTVIITNASTLAFIIPSGGFTAERPLMTCASLYVSDDSQIEFRGLPSIGHVRDFPDKMTLVQAVNTLAVSESQVATLNEQLEAEGLKSLRVRIDDTGTQLILAVRRSGLSIVIR